MLKKEEIFEACKNTINKFKNVDNEDYIAAGLQLLGYKQIQVKKNPKKLLRMLSF